MKSEHWSKYLLGFIIPISVLITLYVGTWWMGTGLVLFLILGPILDYILGEDDEPKPAPESGRGMEAILVLHALFIPLVLIVLLWRAAIDGPTWQIFLGTFSAGIVGGASGIVSAHELGHRKPGSFEWRLGRLTLFLCNYTHFTIEHNHNHHKDVATPSDAASAPASRGLYLHFLITVPWQFMSAVKTDLGVRQNRALRGLFLQIIAIISMGLLLNWWLLIVWIGFSVVSIIMLEYVNYIRHYGLRRSEGERQTHMHSWQTEARWSRWTLMELTRHPSHHMKASLPFWKLQPIEGSPTLPSGYYACFWPCLIPPIWKRLMKNRIPEEMLRLP